MSRILATVDLFRTGSVTCQTLECTVIALFTEPQDDEVRQQLIEQQWDDCDGRWYCPQHNRHLEPR